MADIAAAASRIAHGPRATGPPAKREAAPASAPRAAESAVGVAARPRTPRAPAATRPPRTAPRGESAFVPGAAGATGDKVRLSMAVGKNDGIRPADVVGSIANEADVPGRGMGPIDIRDDITYVVTPASYVDNVLDKVGHARFRGRPVDIQIATGEAPPPRPYTRPAHGETRAPRTDVRPPRADTRPPRSDARPYARPRVGDARPSRGPQTETRPYPPAGAPPRLAARPPRPPAP